MQRHSTEQPPEANRHDPLRADQHFLHSDPARYTSWHTTAHVAEPAGEGGKNQTLSYAASLSLVPGEVKVFSATRLLNKGCCERHEETIVVTDRRVLFQWKRWCWGSATYGREEAFNIDDLKVSGCRRMIKLHRQEAQETYNQLQAMLQNRLALTVPASGGPGCIEACKPPQYPANPQPMQQHYAPVPPQYPSASQPVLKAAPTAPAVGRTQ